MLIIAHGSSKADWVHLVDHAVDQVQLEIPVVTSFLEMVEGRFIADGLRKLEGMGIEEIIVVPLFVSSGSTHIDEISYLLGIKKEIPFEIDEDPIHTDAKIVMCNPMDDHPLIAEILSSRIEELSQNSQEEVLLLVGHGSELDGFRQQWEKNAGSLAIQLKKRFGFKAVSYAFMHPDCLHKRLKALSRKSKVIVQPLFLSEGYFTRKVIPSRMEGLDYQYTGKTYLPNPLISRWIEDVVQQTMKES